MTARVLASNRTSAMIVGLGLLLGACGNGDDDGSATTPGAGSDVAESPAPAESTEPPKADVELAAVDACELITSDVAEAALGAPVGEPIPGDAPPFYSCAYKTENFDIVSVSVLSHVSAEIAADAFQLSIDINDYPEIGGLGDRAYNAQPIGDVTVLIGTYELGVDVSAGEAEDDLSTAMDLAGLALDRLP